MARPVFLLLAPACLLAAAAGQERLRELKKCCAGSEAVDPETLECRRTADRRSTPVPPKLLNGTVMSALTLGDLNTIGLPQCWGMRGYPTNDMIWNIFVKNAKFWRNFYPRTFEFFLSITDNFGNSGVLQIPKCKDIKIKFDMTKFDFP
jgi:hypothetical protein